MAKGVIDADSILNRARPWVHQQAHEIQPFGHLVKLPIALAENVCKESVDNLNQLLADTITLRDLYKAPLAGGRADVLSTAFALRQALRTAERARQRDRRTNPAARRRQHHNGSRRCGHDADCSSTKGREEVLSRFPGCSTPTKLF